MTFLLLEIFGFILVLLYLFYKYEYWNFLERKEEIKEYGVYLLFFKPKHFFQFMQTIFGGNQGSVKIMIYWRLDSADEFIIGSFHANNGRYKIANYYYDNQYNHYVFIKLPIDNLLQFHSKLIKLRHTKWSLIDNNCLTIYKKLFKEYGIKINTIFPSKFLKQYNYKAR